MASNSRTIVTGAWGQASRVAVPVSSRASRSSSTLSSALCSSLPSRRSAAPARGLGGRELKRSFHATAAANQGSNTWHQTPRHAGLVVVPQQMAYVVERFGKFQGILEPGLNILIPVVVTSVFSFSPGASLSLIS